MKLLPLLLIFPLLSLAVPPDSIWMRVIDEGEIELCLDAIRLADGGFMLTGEMREDGNDDSDVMLMRLDGEGNLLWTRDFLIPGGQYGVDLRQTAEDSFLICAYTDYPDQEHALFIAVNGEGTGLGSHRYLPSDSGRGYLSTGIETANGEYLFTGVSQVAGEPLNRIWLFKTNALGDSLWSREIVTDYYQQVTEIVAAENGFLLGGVRSGATPLHMDYFVMKISESGDSLWSRSFGGQGSEQLHDLLQVDDGFILVGSAESFDTGGSDMWMLKIDSNGDSIGSVTYGGDARDVATCIIESSSGELVIGGHSRIDDLDQSFEPTILGISEEGELLWSRSFERSATNDLVSQIVETEEGGFILAGTSAADAQHSDIFLLKLDYIPIINVAPTGLSFGGIFVGEVATEAFELTNIGSDLLTVTGIMTPDGYSTDLTTPHEFEVDESTTVTVTFAPQVAGVYIDSLYILSDAHNGTIPVRLIGAATGGESTDDGNSPIPTEYALFPAYPNPFNPATTIRFALPQASIVLLTTHNISGRLVRTLTDNHYEAGYHSITFDATDLPSGIYIYTINTGTFSNSKKMALVK